MFLANVLFSCLFGKVRKSIQGDKRINIYSKEKFSFFILYLS